MKPQSETSYESRSWKKLSILVTLVFLVTCSSVAFLIDVPTQDPDILFYYYSGQQILSGDGENVRIVNGPVGWPILLAAFDTLVDDPFITAKLFSLIFSSGIVLISYFIIRNIFGQKIALLGQIIIAVNPLLHVESIITHSEMLPVFLIFISIYFITKKQLSQRHVIFCGIFLGLSFMLRPQSLLIGIGMLIFILSSVKKQKKYFTFYLIIFFLLAISPLLIYNVSTTGNILDLDPNFYLVNDSDVSNTEYYKDKFIQDDGIIQNYSKNYFKNLLFGNPHIFLNLGTGYNNFSTIPFIPFSGIIFVLGGIFGLLIPNFPKKYILWVFGLSLIIVMFLIMTNTINTYFLLPIVLPLIIIGAFSFRKISNNIKALLIILLFFMLSISFVNIASAWDLFAILIIPGAFSAFLILNIIPKIITKIQNCLKIDSKILTNLCLAIIISAIVSCNLISSFMVEDNLLFGIPVDYHNLLNLEKNRELVSLEYKEIGEILSKQPNIENKIVMTDSMNYPYYAKSKFMYTNFTEGIETDTLNSFISRENWSKYDIKVSNLSSIPQDRYGVNQHIADYLIYKIDTQNNKNIQILENPNNSKIPTNFEFLYMSNNGETIIYKINHNNTD